MPLEGVQTDRIVPVCILCGHPQHDGDGTGDAVCIEVVGPCQCAQCVALSEPLYAELCGCAGPEPV